MKTAVVAVAALVLSACGQGDAELPGSYAEIIASTEDCGELQDIFDTADRTAEGQRDNGNLAEAKSYTAVMTSTNDRMTEVGCYG